MTRSIFNRAVIGFSYQEAYEKEIKFTPATRAGVEKPLRVRKNINVMNDDENKKEKEILITAIEKSIESGEYGKLVTFHSQFMFDIHSFSGGAHVNQRFLPWHRVYLVKLEEMLNNTMKAEEPGEEYNIAFPYWDWENDRKIPELFQNFIPTMDLEVYLYDDNGQPLGSEIFKNLQVKRFPNTNLSNTLPDSGQINTIKQFSTFFEFTDRLEKRPHNRVHTLVGGTNPSPDPNKPFDRVGTMLDPLISPFDPIFWSHHANIDRIWAGWQKLKLESGDIEFMHPGLGGKESEMTPWFPEYTELQTRQTESMGYKYDII
jgi:hypothetical protein